MTSQKCAQEDDSIQLIEFNSEAVDENNSRNLQTSLTKFKKKNKIDSPTVHSPDYSHSSSSKISDIFVVKPQNCDGNPSKIPRPAPRHLKPDNNELKSSETTETGGDIQSELSQKSVPEKLKNRFRSVKKSAEICTNDAEVFAKTRKKKYLDDNSAVNLRSENDNITREISKYEGNKPSIITENESQYDFFCSVYGIDKPEVENSLMNVVNENSVENEEDDLVERGSDKKSLDEFLGIENLDKEIVEFLRPEVVNFATNESLIFKAIRNSKIKFLRNGFEPSTLEEEGIFRGEIPNIPKRQLDILEERLITEEDRDWFWPNGDLKILPDPRLDNFYKPASNNITHSDFVHKYIAPTLYEPLENNLDIYNNTLEINLHHIHFSHHPLFSLEHVLSRKLVLFYKNYTERVSCNSYLVHRKKLDALRQAKKRLSSGAKSSGDGDNSQILRLEKYKEEIRKSREKMYAESKKEREGKRSILFLWKALKKTRNTQNYSSTSVKLIILKTYDNFDLEKHSWDLHIEEEIQEILEECEKSFAENLRQYKTALKNWKLQKSKLSSGSEIATDRNAEVESLETEENSMAEEMKKLGERPKKPRKKFSEEEIRTEVLERCNESLKPPGEPVLEFEVDCGGLISEEIEDSKEKIRRNSVNRMQIFVKVLYNKREICRSKQIKLDDNFRCSFSENISVQIYKIPKSLTLEIYESGSITSKRLLAEIALSVPGFESNTENSEPQSVEFLNRDVQKFSHTAVGTGNSLKELLPPDLGFDNIDDSILHCSGDISFNLGWSNETSLKSHVINCAKNYSALQTSIPAIFDAENLQEWVQKFPDPQDPQNVLFFDYIKSLEDKTEDDKKYFRIDPYIKGLEFCTDAEIENNPRFKLLKLRDQKEPEFKDLVIPNRVKEIPEGIFKEYELRRREETVSSDVLSEEIQEESIDHQRKWAEKYLAEAENRILRLNKIAEQKLTRKDILYEDFIPSVGSLGLTFMGWFQPKRPLRPVRKTVRQVPTAMTIKELNIMINIVGAIQVPTRNYGGETPSRSDHINLVQVRPFVVVSFENMSVRTTVAEGPNPIWNQEFNLPFRNKDGSLTTTSLPSVKDPIIINLYDETVDDLVMDDRLRETNIHQQIGSNWLGRIEIPFTTLLYSNRIEGTFRVNLPPVLLGYERQSIKTFHASGEPFSQKIDTFLTVFLALQPPIANLQRLVNNELECSELKYVEQRVTNWQNEYNSLHPQRQFSSFVTNINGERCCITRYLKPVKLPQLDAEMSAVTEIQCARYVSLIPFRENSAGGFIPHIWLTADQLLTLMLGSINDHSVLLTCYFMALGLKTWLLLGYGMPQGYTSYVLTREDTSLGYQYYIYDVKSGQKYNVYDNNCPLHKVFCVINDDNVWANIQCDDRIHLTKFDLTKSSEWLPLFGRNISAPTSNLQHVNLAYFEGQNVSYLQEKIEKKLRKKIMKWRKHTRTVWNHYCNLSFKKIIAKLEEQNMLENNPTNSAEHLAQIQNLLTSYQVRGFALSLPYTDVKSLINFVHATGIHVNDSPNTEFSLAVFAKSYPNNAVIIWLFLATLIRNR